MNVKESQIDRHTRGLGRHMRAIASGLNEYPTSVSELRRLLNRTGHSLGDRQLLAIMDRLIARGVARRMDDQYARGPLWRSAALRYRWS